MLAKGCSAAAAAELSRQIRGLESGLWTVLCVDSSDLAVLEARWTFLLVVVVWPLTGLGGIMSTWFDMLNG